MDWQKPLPYYRSVYTSVIGWWVLVRLCDWLGQDRAWMAETPSLLQVSVHLCDWLVGLNLL